MSDDPVAPKAWLLTVVSSTSSTGQNVDRSTDLETITQYAERLLRYGIAKTVQVKDASAITGGSGTVDATVQRVYHAAVKAYEYGVAELPLIPTLEQRVRFAANDLKLLTEEQ